MEPLWSFLYALLLLAVAVPAKYLIVHSPARGPTCDSVPANGHLRRRRTGAKTSGGGTPGCPVERMHGPWPTALRTIAAGFLMVLCFNFPGTAKLPAINFGDLPAKAMAAVTDMAFVASAQAKEAKDGDTKYTCPMHPHYISDHPGTCPICGMDLVKVASAGADAEKSSSDREAIVVAPETLQNMGVRVVEVERANFGRAVRSTGIVMLNERLRTVVTSRVEGWIEDLKVTAVGDPVSKGMVLFELFSPELLVTQRNYLTALASKNEREYQTYEKRLRSFGVQPDAIRLLVERKKELYRVPFYADSDGIVSELPVLSGTYVKRGTTILTIQDYSTVWVSVSVAEKDLAFLDKDTPAHVRFPNIPNRSFATRVNYIYPTVDERTRTGRVRLVIDNRDGAIRPGAFASVLFEIGAKERVAVPSEALLRNDSGSYVIVALGEGRFEPRAVQIGLVSGPWTEIRNGIGIGETVVASGQFMLDSESALRESFRKLERLQLPLAQLKLDTTQLAILDHMIDAALYLHETLVGKAVIDPKLIGPAREAKDALWPEFRHTRLGYVLADAEKAIAASQSARTRSETESALAALIKALEPWIREGAPSHYKDRKVELRKEVASGRMWIQMAGKPLNPYGTGESEPVVLSAALAETAVPDKQDAPAEPELSKPAVGGTPGNAK